MATNSLTDNDIASLAQIFDVTLQYYSKNLSPLKDDYLKKLSTIMGLGFTSILVDGSLLAVHEPQLQVFIRYRDFKAHAAFIGTLSHAIAEMINGTVFISRFIKHSQYYDTFMMTVKNVVNHVTVREAGKAEEAERLMQILFQQHY